MKKTWALLVVITTGLIACADQKTSVQVNAADYQVADQATLEKRLQARNAQFAEDFTAFKKAHSHAFSTQKPVTEAELKKLHMHAVGATALKPTKEAYCSMMNGYFSDIYRLGHFNLAYIQNVTVLDRAAEDAQENFANPDAFYKLVMERATTYRQAQQLMGYGCNLKAALQLH